MLSFDDVSEKFKVAVNQANTAFESSPRSVNEFPGAEYLLLGLLHTHESNATHALRVHGHDLRQLENSILAMINKGLPVPPRDRRLIHGVEDARKIAIRANATRIGTQHLLLAVLAWRDNDAVKLVTEVSDLTSLEDTLRVDAGLD